MSAYYFSTTLAMSMDEADAATREALRAEGFGVLTEIDIQATLKKKINADFRPYRILGACNPPLAHQALQSEGHIGLMLPCNVIIQEVEGGMEVAAVDPVASMAAVENDDLGPVATEVRERLRRVIESLK
ncbi:MAG: hypothetical protein ACI9W4_001660 [Rhodothermales bacterium]|jgi:uncharacterized protein (DUF302 family)